MYIDILTSVYEKNNILEIPSQNIEDKRRKCSLSCIFDP